MDKFTFELLNIALALFLLHSFGLAFEEWPLENRNQSCNVADTIRFNHFHRFEIINFKKKNTRMYQANLLLWREFDIWRTHSDAKKKKNAERKWFYLLIQI